jgi:Methylamine utilisation protein MauE
MGPILAWVGLAAILLAAAALKAADRTGSTVALAAYGIPGRLATLAWAALILVEAALAAGIAAGMAVAAYAAGAVLAGFLVVQSAALAQGGAGAPCGCFGAGGRLSRASAGRTALLAVACAALPLLGSGPDVPLVLTAAVAAAIVVLAAGRRSAPRGALEIDGEGPPLGQPSALAERFEATDHGRVALALFTSPGCALCKRVAPAADALEGVELRRFDEAEDPEAWAAARVPGAPFAVALGPGGVVLAKGTVNDARQLDSVVAAARARQRDADGTSRRAFLGRAGGAVAATAGAGMVGAVIRPGEAEAFHFCGHIYTTDGCPHPTGLPRIDRRGYPLRARDGKRLDDLGRVIDGAGNPLDEDGAPLTDPEGRPLPAAPRSKVCSATGTSYGLRVRTDGSWYRCCHGRVRKLVDCCAPHPTRINGDRSLKGYCYDKRRVFCVMYFQSTVPC